MKVFEVMTNEVVVCLKSDTARTIAALMKQHDIGSVPVVSGLGSKKLEGSITDRDLCVRLVAENLNPEFTSIETLMTRNPVTCRGNDSLQQCEMLMRENRIRRIPVVDPQGRCVGMVAQADIILHDSSDVVRQMLTAISTPRSEQLVGSRAVA